MKTLLAFVLLMIASSSASALTCESLVSQMNKEIHESGSSITEKKLPWMSLHWLQEKLGSAQTSKSENGETDYTWQCKTNQRNYLTVTADKTGTLTNVIGRYSSPSSAQMFTTCLNDGCQKTSAPATPANTLQVNSCSYIARQIYAVGVQFQADEDNPRTNNTYNPQYVWESKSWLDSHLGAATFSHSKQNNIYTWKCAGATDSANENLVYFIASPEGSSIYASKYCDGKKCHITHMVRIFGDIKTTVTTESD